MKGLSRPQIAWRLAQDIPEGACVNLGSGMPLLVSDHVPAGREVIFHSENGILGIGPRQQGPDLDLSLVNAGNIPVTLLPGGAYFHHADSFHMVRGGHIDISVLGAYQVSGQGDLANWDLPASRKAPAVGGAMDLAVGARQVFVMMEYFAKDASAKLVPQCSLPLTGLQCVTRIYSDLAVIEIHADRVVVTGLLPEISLEMLQQGTDVPLILAENHTVLSAPEL
ncbi:MAG: 3-oxoacid CoA-transferase subunit B [Haliea sp.]